MKKDHRQRERARRRRDRKRPLPSSPADANSPRTDPFQQALRYHREGQLPEAQRRYRRILDRDPDRADAWHMLGMAHFQTGENDAALRAMQRAAALAPDNPELLGNFGLVHQAMGDLRAARDCLESAIEKRPDYWNAHNGLGAVWMDLREYELAEAEFRQVVDNDPSHATARSNLGNALHHQGKFAAALVCHQQVVADHPSHTTAFNNLGSTLRSLCQFEAARQAFAQAVANQPHSLEAHINLGRTLVDTQRLDEAIACFELILVRHPKSALAHHYLGQALSYLGRQQEALQFLEKGVELDPESPFAKTSLGWALVAQGDLDRAQNCFRDALELRPDLSVSHSCLLFLMSNDPRIEPRTLFEEHCRWGERHGCVEAPFRSHANDPDLKRRLRVGYVSPDFRQHAVASFFEPVLRCHDATQIESYCYAQVFHEDAMTRTLQRHAHHWRSTCGLADRQVAEQIHRDQIDILVDLAGHTEGNRLISFAYKPAPIQVSWLGYPNTTGLPAIDYRLTSAVQDPEDEESYHVEKLFRLPHGTTCFAPPLDSPAVGPLPAATNGHITFGSLHRPQKLSLGVFDLWSDVLTAIPTARLLMFNTSLTATAERYVRRQLDDRGVDLSRVEIRHETGESTYLRIYNEIDIGLDVFPWSGGTTTREALWMGVTVIGLYGERRSARGTAATLSQVGLDEWIARTPAEYVELAVDLAGDRARLQTLRATMRQRMTETVCNAERFTRELEAGYHAMWRRWCGEQRHQQ